MTRTAFGMAADIATSPADMVMALLPGVTPVRALGKAIASTRPAQALGRFGNRPITRPFSRQPLGSVAEVMKTPANQLPRLSQSERTQFFQMRGTQIKARFAAERAVLQEEKVMLQKEFGKQATERTLQLRPKVPEFLGRQSAHYRKLADAELAPLANELVETKALAKFVTRRWGKDPEALAEVSSRLGLGNEALGKTVTSPILDANGRVISEVVPDTVRLGELYVQAKELGQSIPSSVRESLRVYNRSEHFTDDAIDTLYSFLKEQGINLDQASGFWRQWAPVRNQLVREARPYNLADTQTQAFSRRLMKLAKGLDPDNAVYGKTVAEGLGIPDLPGPLKTVVSKLDSNQKALLANKLQQAEEQGALKAMRFAVDQKATVFEKQAAVTQWIVRILGGGALAGIGFRFGKRAIPE